MNLLPHPRSLKRRPGIFVLPEDKPWSAVSVRQSNTAPNHPEGYVLKISKTGIEIIVREKTGLPAAIATFRQLIAEFGNRLPCVQIRDWPDFSRRGVMLDISRGRVPKLETLLELAEQLADFKINELQLYTEHTFAYRNYKPVWKNWGALTAREIQILDARCRELGIDLVPNQNSFGHLRYFLEHPKLKRLAEIPKPYESETKDFLRRPTTLAPNHPDTLPFLRGLYDELLPNFSSRFFNVGCDETWDLGKGQSKTWCAQKGKGRVYVEFLKKIHSEVSTRGKTMMFWGDIILKYPELIKELAIIGTPSSGGKKISHRPPKGSVPNIIALNWGYEANHPFKKEAVRFARAKIPFYVCPGTSTWQTIIGKHDNALANLHAAAKAGKKHGAIGYLITDWGDGGHPQPLTVSWPMLAAGAAYAWNSNGVDETTLVSALSRDVFFDPTRSIASAALKLGFVHQKLGIKALNETPLGTVIAAPKPEDRELFCRNGLKWFSKVPANKIKTALKGIENIHRGVAAECRKLKSSTMAALSRDAATPAMELDLAARMAAESCHIMLWQQAVAAGRKAEAKQLAKDGIRRLEKLEKDFNHYWPARNKGTTLHCSPFLRWRIQDYRKQFAVPKK